MREATRIKWTDRLLRFQNANCTVAQFCQAEGVSIASFYKWKRQLNRQPSNTQPTGTARDEDGRCAADKRSAFHAVQLGGGCSTWQTVLTVSLPNGSQIQVADHSPTIQTVIRELLGAENAVAENTAAETAATQAESC